MLVVLIFQYYITLNKSILQYYLDEEWLKPNFSLVYFLYIATCLLCACLYILIGRLAT